jgi:LysM repeat protein
MKTYQDFLNSLVILESNGSYKIVNRFGYSGKYQMGKLALIDAGYYISDGTKKNDWTGTWIGKDGINNRAVFLNTSQPQENAIRSYMEKQLSYITYHNLDQYVGQTIRGAVITESGLIAGTRPKGIKGLKTYLESGGASDVRDVNGTPISSYINTFGGYEITESASTPPEPQPLPGLKYTVVSGDTLSGIAEAYGVKLARLLDANPEITNPHLIFPGQTIRIPQMNEGQTGLGLDPACGIPKIRIHETIDRSRQSFVSAPAAVRRNPLILDLDGDGLEATNVKDGVYFDHDGNGFSEQTGWASSDDGLLVLDYNSDGIISSDAELFGDQTILLLMVF